METTPYESSMLNEELEKHLKKSKKNEEEFLKNILKPGVAEVATTPAVEQLGRLTSPLGAFLTAAGITTVATIGGLFAGISPEDLKDILQAGAFSAVLAPLASAFPAYQNAVRNRVKQVTEIL